MNISVNMYKRTSSSKSLSTLKITVKAPDVGATYTPVYIHICHIRTYIHVHMQYMCIYICVYI